MADKGSQEPPGRAHRRKQHRPSRAVVDTGLAWDPHFQPKVEAAPAPAQTSPTPAAGANPAPSQTNPHNTRNKRPFTPYCKHPAPHGGGSPTSLKAVKGGISKAPASSPAKVPPANSPAKVPPANSPRKTSTPRATQPTPSPKAGRRAVTPPAGDGDWKPAGSKGGTKVTPRKGGSGATTPDRPAYPASKRRHGPCCNPKCDDPFNTPASAGWRAGPGGGVLCNACGVHWMRHDKPEDLAALRDPTNDSPSSSQSPGRAAAGKGRRRGRGGRQQQQKQAQGLRPSRLGPHVSDSDSGEGHQESFAPSWVEEEPLGEEEVQQGWEQEEGQEWGQEQQEGQNQVQEMEEEQGPGWEQEQQQEEGQEEEEEDGGKVAAALVVQALTMVGWPAAPAEAGGAPQVPRADLPPPLHLASFHKSSVPGMGASLYNLSTISAFLSGTGLPTAGPGAAIPRSFMPPSFTRMGGSGAGPACSNNVTPFSNAQMPLTNTAHPASLSEGYAGNLASRRGVPSARHATEHDMWDDADEAPGDAAGGHGPGSGFAGIHLCLDHGPGSAYRSLFGGPPGGSGVGASLPAAGLAGGASAGDHMGADGSPMEVEEDEGGREGQQGLGVLGQEAAGEEGEADLYCSEVLVELQAGSPPRQPPYDPKRCASLEDWLPPLPGFPVTDKMLKGMDSDKVPPQPPHSIPSVAPAPLTTGQHFDPSHMSIYRGASFDFQATNRRASSDAAHHHQTTYHQHSAPGQRWKLPVLETISEAGQAAKVGGSSTTGHLGDTLGVAALVLPNSGSSGMDEAHPWSPTRALAAPAPAPALGADAAGGDAPHDVPGGQALRWDSPLSPTTRGRQLLSAVDALLEQAAREASRGPHSSGGSQGRHRPCPRRKRKAGDGLTPKEGCEEADDQSEGATAGQGSTPPALKRGRWDVNETDGRSGW